MSYQLQHKVRLITAASLFDGHDAAINIMRRIMQSKGAEVIHLGHNRSVKEIVEAAIEEDVQGIAITSYQGGHMEFFKYMKDLLTESGCTHVKIFGGGGGTILPNEIDELQAYGITKIYSPDDGRRIGLEGMIEEVLEQCDFPLTSGTNSDAVLQLDEVKDIRVIARKITLAENNIPQLENVGELPQVPVLGITGTGGAGKSSVTDEIVLRFLENYKSETIAVISVDPSKKKTGGALLGDRIRMNAVSHPRVYMRSLATRAENTSMSSIAKDAVDICRHAGFDFIILESAGVGQNDISILDYCNISLYVMTPEYGAASQLEKINMLDFADMICINKFDKPGALDAMNDVCKQYKRSHGLWNTQNETLPVIGTIASQFNDSGINKLFDKIIGCIESNPSLQFNKKTNRQQINETLNKASIIPAKRIRYLSEIADEIRNYNTWVEEQSEIASSLYQLNGSIHILNKTYHENDQ